MTNYEHLLVEAPVSWEDYDAPEVDEETDIEAETELNFED